MTRRLFALATGLMAVIAATSYPGAAAPQRQADAASQSPLTVTAPSNSPQRALLNEYCVTCHNQRLKTGGLALDTVDPANVGQDGPVWEKVVRKLRGGQMPPGGRRKPDSAAREAFVSWLEAELDRESASRLNPGRTETFHRLNRAEYRNVIRDLLALDIDVIGLLPADDVSHGFDNMAGALKLNQSLMERYLSAALRISSAAVGSPPAAPTAEEFRVPNETPQYEHVEGLPFGTRGGTLIPYNFPQDADYDIKVQLACGPPIVVCDGSAGFADLHQLEISVDGERVKLITLEPRDAGTLVNERWQVRIPVKAGPREVAVTFLKPPSATEVEGLRARFLKPYFLTVAVNHLSMTTYQPFVRSVTINGPFNISGPGDTPSRRRIFVCRPATRSEEAGCARKILSAVARRAYRRPVTDADLGDLLTFYRDGRAKGGFEAGIEMALGRLLVSPEFLFRIERDPANVAPNTNYRISDLELASRLSFFLWSSIPDDELLGVASRGRLRDPAVLEQQVRRMLADARWSQALVNNFVGQWLELRNLEAKRPSNALFPDFDESLRLAFRRETELFFESMLREDRNVLELLTANYTFVNERLAKHYGIPNVKGSHFRRITLADEHRRGLLGQGSILTVTSHAIRTSPVLRGKWILNNILGTPPPEPPPNVPALKEKQPGDGKAKILSVRERMAAHRANPVCASCHTVIDPPGFALENFDPVGRWRDVDESYDPIDASGILPDGTRFDGINEFRAALVSHPERFVTTITDKLLTYALGRGLEYYDMPAVRRIVHEAAPDNRFSSLILGIVKSAPFQMRRSASPSPTPVSASRH